MTPRPSHGSCRGCGCEAPIPVLERYGGYCCDCAAAQPIQPRPLSASEGAATAALPPQGEHAVSSDAEQLIGPGDVVLHRPSGQKLVVAYADAARNDLGWCGWPEGIARLSDCELVEKATPQERARLIAAWAGKDRGNDHRIGAVRRLYASEMQGADAATEGA